MLIIVHGTAIAMTIVWLFVNKFS